MLFDVSLLAVFLNAYSIVSVFKGLCFVLFCFWHVLEWFEDQIDLLRPLFKALLCRSRTAFILALLYPLLLKQDACRVSANVLGVYQGLSAHSYWNLNIPPLYMIAGESYTTAPKKWLFSSLMEFSLVCAA